MKKLTIVIATYNVEKTLRQALDSIRYQTYKNIEVIVVDGLSTDKTMDIVKEYSDVVTKFISEKDTGIFNAFNKGINLATGEYICFLGADDCYCNYNVIRDVIDALEADTCMLSAPIKVVNTVSFKEKIMKNKLTTEDVFSGNMLPHPGLFTKLDVMKRYMFNESNKIISDYEFLVRYLLDGGEIKFIDIPVVYFATGGASGGKFGSERWQRQLYEHIVLLNSVGLGNKYITKFISGSLNLNKRNKVSYHLYEALKVSLNRIGVLYVLRRLEKYIRKFFDIRYHQCNLKICRWCKNKIDCGD